MSSAEEVQAIVAAVKSSSKYQSICHPLIARIAATELAKRPKYKEALKATKNKLHQVAGAYLNAQMPYADWLAALRAAPDRVAQQALCQTIMASHASTRERLPILVEFYEHIFAHLGTVNSVLDVACGLNPLAALWMPLPSHVRYTAIDVFEDMMQFLGEAMPLLGISNAHAYAEDIAQYTADAAYDVALVLKTLPCLAQTDKNLGATLLQRLRARWIVVSFPNRSLGGRQKGMASHYDALFQALMEGIGNIEHRLTFASELVYIVTVPTHD